MSETWYVMEDDTVGDPRDIRTGDDGLLVHKDGRKVAYSAHGPRSRSVDREAFGGKGDHDQNGSTGGAKRTAEMKPEPPKKPASRKPYKTREAK